MKMHIIRIPIALGRNRSVFYSVPLIAARWNSTVTPTANSPSKPLQSQPTEKKTSSEKQRKASFTASLIISSFILGAGIAYVMPLSEIAKLIALERLPEPNTPEAAELQSKLEQKLQDLPLFKKLANDPSYEFTRAWSYIDSNALNGSITSGTLSAPGGFAIKPVIFVNKKKREIVTIIHVGQKLCGYPFLVHGGILASILDEILKRGSSFLFDIDPLQDYNPERIKTNLIELQYKFPTLSNNFIVVKTSINEKGLVVGDIETLKGRLLVKGLGEFVKRESSTRKSFGLF